MKANIFSLIVNFINETRQELTKVVWPKKENVIRLTTIVILLSAVVGLYLGALDFGFTKILETLFVK